MRAALNRRAAEHTSGWRNVGGRPAIELGPVKGAAAHWRGEKLIKAIGRAWPFVAVLEYDGEGKPQAFIDWFKRAKGNKHASAWTLDPLVDYANHINAEAVCGQDDEWCYMAVMDTPTGHVVGSFEFAIRARIRWADGRTVTKGWWTWCMASKSTPERDWYMEMVPLVDWRASGRKGRRSCIPLDDPEHELAVWGTDMVFRFPRMPPGLRPCTGRS